MQKRIERLLYISVFASLICFPVLCHAQSLDSWNDTASKKAIIEFASKVTNEGSKDYIQPSERIAVCDNDGTLWAEQLIYFQFLFAIDRVGEMAPDHPEWKTTEPFENIL